MKYLTLLAILCSCVEKDIQNNSLIFRTSEITRTQLRQDYDFLNEEDFDNKLRESLESPLMFYRSFPISFYKDIKLTFSAKEGLCLGDSHVDNFGFILFENETRYLFNDLDDSGPCPLSLDILRYFSSLYFLNQNEDQIKGYIEYYLSHLLGMSPFPSMPSALIKDLEEKRLKNLTKYTADDRFILDDSLIMISEDLKTELANTVREKIPNVQFLDSASYLKVDGGSGGLSRYWILLKSASDQFDIIELKERAIAATSYSTTNQSPPDLKTLAQSIWGELPIYFEEVFFKGKSYQIRSRTKDDINLNKVDASQQEIVLKIQLALMARHHRLYEFQKEPPTLEWLYQSSKLIAKRYQESFEDLKLK